MKIWILNYKIFLLIKIIGNKKTKENNFNKKWKILLNKNKNLKNNKIKLLSLKKTK